MRVSLARSGTDVTSSARSDRLTALLRVALRNKFVRRAERLLGGAHLAALEAGVEVLNRSGLVTVLNNLIFLGGIFVSLSWLDNLLERSRLRFEVLESIVLAGKSVLKVSNDLLFDLFEFANLFFAVASCNSILLSQGRVELGGLMVVLIAAHFVLGDYRVFLVVEVSSIDLLRMLLLESLVVKLVVAGFELMLDVVTVVAGIVDNAVSVLGDVGGGYVAAFIVKLLLRLNALSLINLHLLLVIGLLFATV